MYCEQCGTKNDDGTKFCTGCGAKLAADGSVEVPGPNTSSNSASKAPKKWVKKLVLCVIAITVLVGGGMLGYNFILNNFEGKTDITNIPLVYTKEGSLWLKNNKKKTPFTLTNSYGYGDPYESNYSDYSYVQMSDDGKLVFFADGISNGEFRLYYRKTSGDIPKGKEADEKGIKLASGVTSYKIAPDGSFVLYNKGDRLYYSNLKEETSIASGVIDFYLSTDLKKVIFQKSGGDLYLCGLGAKDEPEKVDVDVSYIVSNSNEYQKIYYVKDNSLYMKEYGKDKVKIMSDVFSATMIGDIVFATEKDESVKSFNDLFDDDCAATDAQIAAPSYSDFKVPSENGGLSTDYDAYYLARDKYNEKKERDKVREYYSENAQIVYTYSLYKVVGYEAQKVDEGLFDGYIGSSHIIKKRLGNDSKIPMSTVKSYSEAKDKVNNLGSNIEKQYELILSNGNLIKLEGIDPDYYDAVSSDEKYFYCIEDMNSTGTGTLNRYEITSDGIASKTKIRDEVSSFVDYGSVLVIYDDNVMGVYENEKYTELSDSTIWTMTFIDNTLYYYDNYSFDKEIGNLMIYKDGKKEQIDIDVHEYVARGDNLCYYIKDYSMNSKCGDLYKKDGTKSEKVDIDVNHLIKER